MEDTLVAEPPKKETKKSLAERKFLKQKEVVRSAIASATAQFIKKNGYDAVQTDDDMIKKLGAAIYDFGSISSSDYGRRIAKCFEIALNKPIPYATYATKAVTWVRFAAIIPTSQGSHNYPLNKVVIVTQDQKGYREDGTFGNSLDNNQSYYRPATSEEIDKLTNETYSSLIREFLVMA